MSHVTICTPARDAAGLLAGYWAQLAALDWPAEDVRYIVCEGDSADYTAVLLDAWATTDSRVRIVHCHTGKPHYGSVVNAERFAVLAAVYNTALDAVDYAWSDYVLMLQVDIHFSPLLLRRLVAHDVDIVAPLIFRDNIFYDIWGFSRHGSNFPPFPAWRTAEFCGLSLLDMETIGGTTLFKAAVLRDGSVRYTPEQVDRGMCATARSQGCRVWADPQTWVEHPVR
jgi:hypothetical protein